MFEVPCSFVQTAQLLLAPFPLNLCEYYPEIGLNYVTKFTNLCFNVIKFAKFSFQKNRVEQKECVASVLEVESGCLS